MDARKRNRLPRMARRSGRGEDAGGAAGYAADHTRQLVNCFATPTHLINANFVIRNALQLVYGEMIVEAP